MRPDPSSALTLRLPLYSHPKQPFFQTSAKPWPPDSFWTPNSKVYQVPSGSASVGVGWPRTWQRSLKWDWQAAFSLSFEACHLAMNCWGVMRGEHTLPGDRCQCRAQTLFFI